MSRLWFTADHHFGHVNMTAQGKGWRPFDTVQEHDEHLIWAWNQRVKPGDTVWHLGDVGMGSTMGTFDCLRRLNGTKHLVAGNHDPCWPGHRGSHTHQREWLEVFASVQSCARIKPGRGPDWLLSHFPYHGDQWADDRHKAFRLTDTGSPLLHGHVHTQWTQKGLQLNVGVDQHQWGPVPIEEVLERFRNPTNN